MSTGDPPGFFTTLPVAALLVLIGSAVTVAYCLRALASRSDATVRFSTPILALACVGGQLVVMLTTGGALTAVGGLPAGPIYGPAVPLLLVIYVLPLAFVSSVFGRTVLSQRRRRHWLLGAGVFATAHLAAVPVTWALFVLLD
ncbi:hypothetical protein [Halomicrobium salinisoli]|uniref:hypothetical protein n=1 Tax=Halomicrobium salinisoli TaxID=2878391 RepID=UPI001CEFFC17|nr:hypothetical protein [Halomicrobium salinisoli]